MSSHSSCFLCLFISISLLALACLYKNVPYKNVCTRMYCVILEEPLFSSTQELLWSVQSCQGFLGYEVFSMPAKISVWNNLCYVGLLLHAVTEL